MYKYTVEYVKNNKVGLFVKTEEDVNGLEELNCKGHMVSLKDFPEGFYTCPFKNSWSASQVFFKLKFEVINASDFIKENLKIMNKEVDLVNDEFIVNCIDNTKEERQLVYKFLVDNRDYGKLYLSNDYNVIICNKKGGDSNYNSLENAKETYPEYKVYTFNEFKQKYLNINKEIIAYKLVKPEFRKAVNSILDKIGNILRQDGITEDYNTHNLLKEAGVLDLWFEPVYKKEKPKEIVYNMGSFELKITNEGIFHKSENIVVFVTNLYNFYSKLPSKFGNYDCTVDEITFKKTGCETNITRYKDWFKVYEEYKNLQ